MQSAGTRCCDSVGVWLGCDSRFGREPSSQKPSEAALEGDRQGLFRAQATRESRHGRRPRAAFRFYGCVRARPFVAFRIALRRPRLGSAFVPCGVASGSPASVWVADLPSAGVAQVPALRDRATGRSGGRR